MSRAKLIPLSVWLLIAVASSVSNSQERGFIRLHSINLRPTDAVVLNTKQDVDVQTVQSRPSKRSSIGQLTVKEKELLNCFMARLKREPTATGWIRIDLERRRVDEPSLTDLVTLYLMTKHNRDFKRVSIMGTYRLDQEMELFIIPSGEDAIPVPEKTAKAKCSKRTRRHAKP